MIELDNCILVGPKKNCDHSTFHYCSEGTHCDKHCRCPCGLCVQERFVIAKAPSGGGARLTRQITNARVHSTMLGIEDHGCFTCWLNLDYACGGQGFGGYVFKGSAFGIEFIKAVLKIADADRWENLPGKVLRIDYESDKVHRIGHFLRDEWFDPQELARQYK